MTPHTSIPCSLDQIGYLEHCTVCLHDKLRQQLNVKMIQSKFNDYKQNQYLKKSEYFDTELL